MKAAEPPQGPPLKGCVAHLSSLFFRNKNRLCPSPAPLLPELPAREAWEVGACRGCTTDTVLPISGFHCSSISLGKIPEATSWGAFQGDRDTRSPSHRIWTHPAPSPRASSPLTTYQDPAQCSSAEQLLQEALPDHPPSHPAGGSSSSELKANVTTGVTIVECWVSASTFTCHQILVGRGCYNPCCTGEETGMKLEDTCQVGSCSAPGLLAVRPPLLGL